MRFFAFALLAIAAVSAVQAEDSNGVLDSHFSIQKRDNTKKNGKKCEPLKLFKKFCNMCFCGPDGKGFVCTIDKCPEGAYNEDGTIIPTTPNEKCEPLSHFKVNCNDCWCKSDGQGARCDTSTCPDVTCKPGTVVRKDCDECVCKPSGKEMVCYTKHCDDPFDPRPQYTVTRI